MLKLDGSSEVPVSKPLWATPGQPGQGQASPSSCRESLCPATHPDSTAGQLRAFGQKWPPCPDTLKGKGFGVAEAGVAPWACEGRQSTGLLQGQDPQAPLGPWPGWSLRPIMTQRAQLFEPWLDEKLWKAVASLFTMLWCPLTAVGPSLAHRGSH